MGVVIGKGAKFYNIPEDVLAKYTMTEEQVKPMREQLNRIKVTVEEPEVEGYGDFSFSGITSFWEMLGVIPYEPLMPVGIDESGPTPVVN